MKGISISNNGTAEGGDRVYIDKLHSSVLSVLLYRRGCGRDSPRIELRQGVCGGFRFWVTEGIQTLVADGCKHHHNQIGQVKPRPFLRVKEDTHPGETLISRVKDHRCLLPSRS